MAVAVGLPPGLGVAGGLVAPAAGLPAGLGVAVGLVAPAVGGVPLGVVVELFRPGSLLLNRPTKPLAAEK